MNTRSQTAAAAPATEMVVAAAPAAAPAATSTAMEVVVVEEAKEEEDPKAAFERKYDADLRTAWAFTKTHYLDKVVDVIARGVDFTTENIAERVKLGRPLGINEIDETTPALAVEFMHAVKEPYERIFEISHDNVGEYHPYPPEQLYNLVSVTAAEFLRDHSLPALARRTEGADDCAFLAAFAQCVRDFEFFNEMLREVLKYALYHVYWAPPGVVRPTQVQCGNRVFDETVLALHHARVLAIALAAIDADRRAPLAASAVADLRAVFTVLARTDTYAADVEAHVFAETARHFAVVETWLADEQLSVSETGANITRAIETETARAHSFFTHAGTARGIVAALVDLVVEHSPLFLPRARTAMVDCNDADLACIYAVFRLKEGAPADPDDDKEPAVTTAAQKAQKAEKAAAAQKAAAIYLAPIVEAFAAHLDEAARGLFAAHHAACAACADPKTAKEAQKTADDALVVALVALHARAERLLTGPFENNATVRAAARAVFCERLNVSSAHLRDLAPVLAGHLDRRLRAPDATESDVERTVELLVYLKNQDVFADAYRIQLARRLLTQRSTSADAESAAVAAIKRIGGAQFTSKLEGMLFDFSVAADSTTAPGAVVQILTGGHWPIARPYADANLPPFLARARAAFQAGYDKADSRKITWALSLGACTVRAAIGGKSYELNVSTLQAVVLAAFSTPTAELDFEELRAHTNLDAETLKRLLHSLSAGNKFNVLAVARAEDGGRIRVNHASFSSPLRKLRIPVPTLDDHTAQTDRRIEDARAFAIDASIVRTMKARSTMNHQALVTEVLSQLAHFRPEAKAIKLRIESLIGREYLDRGEEHNVYVYLA